jgi:hypothetical protein
MLSACASGGGGSGTTAADLQMYPSDPCGAQRQEFVKGKSYFAVDLASSVFGSAYQGALDNYNSTKESGGNTFKAFFKGVGGAFKGGKSGYFQARAGQAKDQQELEKNINSDLTTEGKNIDSTTAAFARLRACRFAEATRIKTSVRAHRLDRVTGVTQIEFERDRFSEEVGLAHTFGLNMAQHDDQFKDASAAVQEVHRERPREGSSHTASQVNQLATVSIPDKRSSFDKAVGSAEQSGKVAFDIDSSAKLTELFSDGINA